MPREVNCLPSRIKTLLAVINRGEMDLMVQMIDESNACPHVAECDVGLACRRIHAAFVPLAPQKA